MVIEMNTDTVQLAACHVLVCYIILNTEYSVLENMKQALVFKIAT